MIDKLLSKSESNMRIGIIEELKENGKKLSMEERWKNISIFQLPIFQLQLISTVSNAYHFIM